MVWQDEQFYCASHMNNLAKALGAEDLGSLSVAEQPGSVIKRLRDHHHQIARLVAEGKRTGEIAAEIGMSVSRVSILKGDPAFKQLVEMYRPQIEEARQMAFATAQQKAALLAEESIDQMYDRLIETPEAHSFDQLRETAVFGLEYSGQGKVHKSLQGTVDLTNHAERLAKARQRVTQLCAPATGVKSEPTPELPAEGSASTVVGGKTLLGE